MLFITYPQMVQKNNYGDRKILVKKELEKLRLGKSW